MNQKRKVPWRIERLSDAEKLEIRRMHDCATARCAASST
jgi:hypothetical protein